MTTTDVRPQSTVRGEPDKRVRGPFRRVVVGALALGALSAVGLTVGVLAGAAEHVVTGVALLAFAGGWALLAALTSRLTSAPQRWAYLPAASMALTGLGLLVLAPDDAAMTSLGWLWPPALLALAVWSGRRTRTSMPGRTRWLLFPVLAVTVLAAVGGLLESIALQRAPGTEAAPGRLHDVGGHRLHLDCVGSGSPTVVLLNGLSETSPFWSRVSPEVARSTRVCSYDRAGQGWSDDARRTPDADAVVADLHALLAAADEQGPFVLAGHSSGGVYAMAYAAQHPDDVAGMVLLDSSTPDQYTAIPSFAAEHRSMKRVLALAPSLARVGAGHLLPAPTGLLEPAATRARAFSSSPRGADNLRREHASLPDAFRQAGALTTLGDAPLVVVTASENVDGTPGWEQAQERLTNLSSDADHRVVDATHSGLLTDATDSAASADAVIDVVRSVRTGTPVATP